MSYLTDKDEELVALINECLDGLSDAVKADYILNCITLKHRQGLTVKQIFREELESKKRFEEELNARREKVNHD